VTAGEGALDRANEGCVVPVGRTNEDVGAVYGFGAGLAAEGVGAGAELYFDPEDSFIRLRMWAGVMSASFRAWMVRWEFLRKEDIWDAYVSVRWRVSMRTSGQWEDGKRGREEWRMEGNVLKWPFCRSGTPSPHQLICTNFSKFDCRYIFVSYYH
jgi:hypothetical protein